MAIIEEHWTPDGLFRFIVERGDDGDISLGFDGFASHTHGDVLASLSGLPIHEAIRDYLDRLFNGLSFICIASVAGRIRDVWVTEDSRPDKYKPEEELMKFRYWDGRPVA
jgi:hypothetical protein